MFGRGFKTWCERTAESLREKWGGPSAPLPARILGEELSVEIVTPLELHELRPEIYRWTPRNGC
jgi:hypothetical protein